MSELPHRSVRQNGKSNRLINAFPGAGVIAHAGVIVPVRDKNQN